MRQRPTSTARKLFWIISGTLAIALMGYVVDIVRRAGAFVKIVAHGISTDRCQVFENVPGPEDMDFDAETGLIFVASANRPPATSSLKAGIYVIEPKSQEASPQLVASDASFEVLHGIDVFRDGGELFVAVINHKSDGSDTLEILKYQDHRLDLVRTIADPILYNANDVLALSLHEIYLTHDLGSRHPLSKSLEQYTGWGRGFVSYYNGSEQKLRKVASGVFYANGIAQDPLSSRIFVASMLDQKVLVFDRDKSTGNLKEFMQIRLESSPDNLDFDTEGSLWIGAHPKVFDLKAHSEDPQNFKAPSQILKINSPASAEQSVSEMILDDGEKIAAASVALHRDGILYLGSIYQAKVMTCKL